MKKLSCATMTVLLFGLLFAQAQSASANDNTRVQSKGVVLSGQVSGDGKQLLADDDNVWVVSNANVLKGLEGKQVSVRCRMDVKNRAIQVLSIVDQSRSSNTAHLGDAAFRR